MPADKAHTTTAKKNLASSSQVPRSISVFLFNCRLLNLDKHEDWPAISAQTFSINDAIQNQKRRVLCAEWAFYMLFRLWDAEETSNKLQPFFPAFESLQSLNLRAALFRCLNELKKNGTLGKEVMVRKTMFDDCKGDRFLELLAAFSTLVLKKVLASEQAGSASIVGRLCLLDRMPKREQDSLLPLAVAHRASLKALLRKKQELNSRYHDFNRLLKLKDEELDRKFSEVVQTQEFLDQNVASEATVSRVARQFESHWQDDRRLIDVIAQGEGLQTEDALLDVSFAKTWPSVGNGTFIGDLSTNRRGLLEDLERRVAEQSARLHHWKGFQEKLQRSAKPRPTTRQTELFLPPTKSLSLDLRREKDLVFTPRRSPRKSDWRLVSVSNDSPLPGGRASVGDNDNQLASTPTPKPVDIEIDSEPVKLSLDSSFSNEDDGDSAFSEISEDNINQQFPGPARRDSEKGLGFPIPVKSRDADGTVQLQIEDDFALSKVRTTSNFPNDQNRDPERNSHDLAERILLSTLNAPPTPGNALPPLLDRTRKSLALTNPSTRLNGIVLTTTTSTPPIPECPTLDPHPSFTADTKTTLLERTRQSISLVPSRPKPKPSRKSRLSKIDPTNQFETPGKGLDNNKARESTPPEQLFSPGAGYESVFKSRPKVCLSPVSSPSLLVGVGEDRDGSEEGSENEDTESERGMEVGDSPSVRRVAGK